jgi:hypothetical protein
MMIYPFTVEYKVLAFDAHQPETAFIQDPAGGGVVYRAVGFYAGDNRFGKQKSGQLPHRSGGVALAPKFLVNRIANPNQAVAPRGHLHGHPADPLTGICILDDQDIVVIQELAEISLSSRFNKPQQVITPQDVDRLMTLGFLL